MEQTMNEYTSWRKQIKQVFFHPKGILRLTGAIILVQLTSLILGFHIFVITMGLIFGLLWIFPYWQFAYSIIHKISKASISPSLVKPDFPWWNYMALVVRLSFAAYLIYFGISSILKFGFYEQSWFCQ